jgi:hypothetical protein
MPGSWERSFPTAASMYGTFCDVIHSVHPLRGFLVKEVIPKVKSGKDNFFRPSLIRYSQIISSLNVILCELLAASLNDPQVNKLNCSLAFLAQ